MATNTTQKQAAKQFAKDWSGKGYEKGETSRFWIGLLQNVFGIQDATKFIEFELPVKTILKEKGSDFIDGYIPSTKVLIEQKGSKVNLGAKYRQSDGSELTPYQQARRYAAGLPLSMAPRWIVACNFTTFEVHDMERPNDAPEVIQLAELEKEYTRLSFLVDDTNVHLKKELEVSIDLLVYQDFGKMTETELYILRFLNSLARDTKDDRMVWKINNLGKYIETTQSGGVPNDPLFNYLVGVEQKKDSAQYRSLFSGKILRCVENSFVGNLRGSDAQMYILRCADDAAKQNEAQQFFEIYIVSEKKVNPLLCTAQTREALVSAVDQLFEAVEISATHIHLNEDVKAVIDLYFNPIFS